MLHLNIGVNAWNENWIMMPRYEVTAEDFTHAGREYMSNGVTRIKHRFLVLNSAE
jgi:hypothetical protein